MQPISEQLLQALFLLFLLVLTFCGTDVQARANSVRAVEDHVILQRRKIVLVRSAQLAKRFPSRKTVQNLDDFSVGRMGITFLYDAGFPHVFKAFEPQGRYFFNYAQLKPYLKDDGPLGQFIR